MVNDNNLANTLVPYLTEEDIPENYHDIINSIGINNFMKLLELVGGTSLYFPKIETMIGQARNRMIIKESKGNYRELARKYGVTDSWIRRIITNKGDSL